MLRYLVTCDACPDWQHMTSTPDAASLAARSHGELCRSEDRGSVDATVRQHEPLARKFAARAVHSAETFDDVYADALIGLWKAAKAFDPGRGVKFSTYAATRILGEIADGRRQRDPLSRRARQDGAPVPVSFDAIHEADGIAIADRLADPCDDLAAWHDAFDRGLALGRLHQLLDRLRDDERAVILAMLDGRGAPKQLAAKWQVTESRISQIKQGALAHLHALAAA